MKKTLRNLGLAGLMALMYSCGPEPEPHPLTPEIKECVRERWNKIEEREDKKGVFKWYFDISAYMKNPGSIRGTLDFLLNQNTDFIVQFKNDDTAFVGISYRTKNDMGIIPHYYYVVEEYIKKGGDWRFSRERDKFRTTEEAPFGKRDPGYKPSLKVAKSKAKKSAAEMLRGL